jgi:uncharacterized protein YqhQ
MSAGGATAIDAPPAVPPGKLTASRDAPIGGQAVIEGVMMRGVRTWAVAVREPGPDDDTLGPIAVKRFPLESWIRRHRVYRLPVIRGVVALAESLTIGIRALGIAANAQLPPAEREADDGSAEGDAEGMPGGVWAGAIVLALVFAIGLFFVVPVTLTSLIKHQLGSSLVFWLVEGVVRTAIFLGYLLLLSRMRDLRRVFEYHGAEHKVISCYEAGDELVPARAALYSRLHPRCGTSFLLVVMIVAIFVFAPIGLPAWWILVLTRIFGVPVIAGLSFEVIKWAGRNRRHAWVRAVMYPGMKLQLLTTREPDLDQLAVSIASLKSVLEAEGPDAWSATDLVGVELVA